MRSRFRMRMIYRGCREILSAKKLAPPGKSKEPFLSLSAPNITPTLFLVYLRHFSYTKGKLNDL